MKNKRGKKLQIVFSNRWLYTFILLGLLIIVAVGVSALTLTAGIKPYIGHTINETAPPAECSENQYLQWTGTDWVCSTITPQLSCHLENSSTSWTATAGGYWGYKSCSSGEELSGSCYCGGSFISGGPAQGYALPTGSPMTGWKCKCSSDIGNSIVLTCCANFNYNVFGNTGFTSTPIVPPPGILI